MYRQSRCSEHTKGDAALRSARKDAAVSAGALGSV
jgi:hypothetical protein